MMKVLFFLSLFLLLASPTWAWDFCAPNADGIMLYYNMVDEDEGACEVAQNEGVVWDCRVLRIPETLILNRGNRDFGDPDTICTVIGIGDHAFYSRYKPLDPDKDYEPTSLFEHVMLPKTISYIDDYAFYGCLWLSVLDFPEGNEWLRHIGESAFAWAGPTRLTIPKTLETLSPHAFEYSGVTYLEFEKGNTSLTKIPDYCFRGTTVKEIKFSPEIKTIGKYAFAECTLLNSPKLPYGLEILEKCAFWRHSYWESFEIPATIVDIGEYAFCYVQLSDGMPKGPARLSIKNLYVNKATTPYCISEKSLGDNEYDYNINNYTRLIKDTNLIVPLGCIDEYATTWPWDRFDRSCIMARDLSGIKPAKVKTSQPEGVFSLDGRRLAKPQKGLNIIRYKDGTAKKVLMK